MKLQDYDISTQVRASVLSNQRVTAAHSRQEVREIKLNIGEQFHVLPGQNIGVLVPKAISETDEPHFRLYSIADSRQTSDGNRQLHIYVRRCQYFDRLTGENHLGVASNYLCDCKPGDELTVTGPYGQAFELPKNHRANLILIGTGTGIAPFRAFLKHVYRHQPEFAGNIYLFYGGETGLDLLYGNDREEDASMYYDQSTFEAIEALSNSDEENRFNWSDALQSRTRDLTRLLCDPKTFIYIAGLENIRDELEEAMIEVAGSNQRWHHWKKELVDDGRWIELLY
ncbi:MAG: FAD-binding oxidoreductase [Rubripirellula sp.]